MDDNLFSQPVAPTGEPAPDLQCLSARPIVCVQGLGFVGAAVCIAIASARDVMLRPAYQVIGVDLPTVDGSTRVAALNRGEFPFTTTDPLLASKAREAHATGNLTACTDPLAFASASIIIVDVPLDAGVSAGGPTSDLGAFRGAMHTLGRHMRPDALVIVETTVPPGTTARVVAPILRGELESRGLPANQFRLAHCYERVMPGAHYFDSIVRMPRVYAGANVASADACETFLRTIADAECDAPVRLASTTASEFGKVLENTYRAATIALIDEFAAFAETVDVDLFEVIAAIRSRPSHSNIRVPGLGVGGYCLTKDPLLAPIAARELFGFDGAFPFAMLTVATNNATPGRVAQRLRALLAGSLAGRRILLLGLSYREGVGDTRCSPAQALYEAACTEGAQVAVHDPLVSYWRERDLQVPAAMPSPAGMDAVVLTVAHQQYRTFDYATWLGENRPLFLDTFNVLSSGQRRELRALGCHVESVGRGAGL